MDNTAPPVPELTPPQNQSTNVAVVKKSRQISVDKVFITIYVFVLLAIFSGPLLFTADDSFLVPFAIFVVVGIPLLIVLVILHVFLLWREKKKKTP